MIAVVAKTTVLRTEGASRWPVPIGMSTCSGTGWAIQDMSATRYIKDARHVYLEVQYILRLKQWTLQGIGRYICNEHDWFLTLAPATRKGNWIKESVRESSLQEWKMNGDQTLSPLGSADKGSFPYYYWFRYDHSRTKDFLSSPAWELSSQTEAALFIVWWMSCCFSDINTLDLMGYASARFGERCPMAHAIIQRDIGRTKQLNPSSSLYPQRCKVHRFTAQRLRVSWSGQPGLFWHISSSRICSSVLSIPRSSSSTNQSPGGKWQSHSIALTIGSKRIASSKSSSTPFAK